MYTYIYTYIYIHLSLYIYIYLYVSIYLSLSLYIYTHIQCIMRRQELGGQGGGRVFGLNYSRGLPVFEKCEEK